MKFTVLTDAHGATLDDLRATHKSLVTSGSKQVNWILLGAVPDAVKNLQRRWSFGRVKIEIQPPALGLGEFVVIGLVFHQAHLQQKALCGVGVQFEGSGQAGQQHGLGKGDDLLHQLVCLPLQGLAGTSQNAQITNSAAVAQRPRGVLDIIVITDLGEGDLGRHRFV
jgi:hypothetical protein